MIDERGWFRTNKIKGIERGSSDKVLEDIGYQHDGLRNCCEIFDDYLIRISDLNKKQ